jgi:cobyrinic acid a,c-diamide synthase
MRAYSRLVIAGVQSGVGKTTVTLGILGALARKGLAVQPFKAGPDFIDPGHHTAALGGARVSRNLDTWMMPPDAVRELFARSAAKADISVVEGVMGLFDGVSGTDEAGSAAHLAKTLEAPVVLVVDAKGMARSAAALVHGYATLDPKVRLAGVVFNNVAGAGHYAYLKDAVASLTGVKPLGYIRREPGAGIPERHLGLRAAAEGRAGQAYERMTSLVEEGVDLQGLLGIARSAAPFPGSPSILFANQEGRRGLVAIARDEAFHFVYEDNLDLLRHLGAEVVFFSPLEDRALPERTDLVWLGGGYPELFAGELSENRPMLEALRGFQGKVYAECGGLMYCLETLHDVGGLAHPMVGLLPGGSRMMSKRQGLGYLEVTAERDCLLAGAGTRFRAHEFHYSKLDPAPSGEEVAPAFSLRKPWKGDEVRPDGWMRGRVLAGYTHVHFAACPALAVRLLGP